MRNVWSPTLGTLLALTVPAAAQDSPSLTVAGQARLERPADELRLQLAVVTEAAEAAPATAQNSDQMERVLAALSQAGLDSGETTTGRFSVSPRYSHRPPQAQPDWQPHIVGYRVENSVQVETKKIELAGELIDVAVRAGANSVSSISFGLSDDRAYRAEAIREATAHARADALAMAEAAGVRLGRLLSARLDDAAAPPVPIRMRTESFAVAASAPPIEPGDVSIHARVTLSYEITEP
jgi:uncharacterized protein YggE